MNKINIILLIIVFLFCSGCAVTRVLQHDITASIKKKNNPLLEIKSQEYSGTCKYDPDLDKYYVERLLFGEGRKTIISVVKGKYGGGVLKLEEISVIPDVPLKEVPLRITTADLPLSKIDNQNFVNSGIIISLHNLPANIVLYRLNDKNKRDYYYGVDELRTQLNWVRRKHKATAGLRVLWFLVTVPIDIVTFPLQLIMFFSTPTHS